MRHKEAVIFIRILSLGFPFFLLPLERQLTMNQSSFLALRPYLTTGDILPRLLLFPFIITVHFIVKYTLREQISLLKVYWDPSAQPNGPLCNKISSP